MYNSEGRQYMWLPLQDGSYLLPAGVASTTISRMLSVLNVLYLSGSLEHVAKTL